MSAPCIRCGKLCCGRAIGLGSEKCCACNGWTSCPNCFSGDEPDQEDCEAYPENVEDDDEKS